MGGLVGLGSGARRTRTQVVRPHLELTTGLGRVADKYHEGNMKRVPNMTNISTVRFPQ